MRLDALSGGVVMFNGRRRLAAQPQVQQDDAPFESLEALERRSYDTYRSRMQAYRRLRFRNATWNGSLIAFSTSITIASVGMLTDHDMYGDAGDLLLASLGVLGLVASLIVSNMDYSGRSRIAEINY